MPNRSLLPWIKAIPTFFASLPPYLLTYVYFRLTRIPTWTRLDAKWWGCSVTGPVKGERDESGVPVFTLHYDAFEAFEEADHNVTFVDKYRLIHLEDGAEMTWKKEGHEVDREALMASLADEDVDLQEVYPA